jgi:hypothetical protein
VNLVVSQGFYAGIGADGIQHFLVTDAHFANRELVSQKVPSRKED